MPTTTPLAAALAPVDGGFDELFAFSFSRARSLIASASSLASSPLPLDELCVRPLDAHTSRVTWIELYLSSIIAGSLYLALIVGPPAVAVLAMNGLIPAVLGDGVPRDADADAGPVPVLRPVARMADGAPPLALTVPLAAGTF